MARAPATVSAGTARGLFLSAQGLLAGPARRPPGAALRRTSQELGLGQIDPTHVLDAAHPLPLWSRLEGYRPAQLDRLLARDRAIFEHWTHDASVIPIELFPYWKVRFRRYHRTWETKPWWRERIGRDPEQSVRRVLRRIEREGP